MSYRKDNIEHEGIQFLTSSEVSKLLRMPLSTLYDNTKNGKIKAVKIGKRWKYRKVDVDRYISSGTDFTNKPVRKSPTFIERRSCPRINTNFRCQYSVNLPPYKETSSEGIVKNLSARGILLDNQDRGIAEIKINDPINLDFSLINKDKTINIKTEGRIIRKDSIGLGIKFRNIDKDIRNKLIQYVG